MVIIPPADEPINGIISPVAISLKAGDTPAIMLDLASTIFTNSTLNNLIELFSAVFHYLPFFCCSLSIAIMYSIMLFFSSLIVGGYRERLVIETLNLSHQVPSES